MSSRFCKLRRHIFASLLCPTLFIAVLLAGPILAAAQTFTTIYTFPGGTGGPGGLVVGTAGALYGISGGGVPKSCGTSACGMVFQLTPPVKSGGNWTLSTIYKFLGGSDGGNPVGRLLVGNKGAIYGVTFNGGNAASSCDVTGCGTVFQLTPPVKTGGSWTKKTIYSFSGPDGANPLAGVISDKLGNLHGTTSGGGDSNALAGIVFELSPPAVTGNPWTETLIHAFNPFDGRHD